MASNGRTSRDAHANRIPPLTEYRTEAVFPSDSPEATFAFGERLGRHLVGGLVIGLVGPLGAGKTILVKGVAAGNALVDVSGVTSPTFTLVHEYAGRLRLIHMDVYRLKDAGEFPSLGFDEMVQADACVIIEWADRVVDFLPKDRIWIELVPTGELSRQITVTGLGTRAALVLRWM